MKLGIYELSIERRYPNDEHVISYYKYVIAVSPEDVPCYTDRELRDMRGAILGYETVRSITNVGSMDMNDPFRLEALNWRAREGRPRFLWILTM